MKKLTRNILLVLLVLAMVICGMTACKNGGDDPSDTPAQTSDGGQSTGDQNNGDDTAIPATPEYLVVATDGVPVNIVVSTRPTDEELVLADRIGKALLQKTGNQPRQVTAKAAGGSDVVEILVGATGLAETNEVAKSLPYGDWTITCCGNKLVLMSYMDTGMTTMSSRIVGLLSAAKEEDGKLRIDGSYHQSGSVISSVAALPRLDGKIPEQVFSYQSDSSGGQVTFGNSDETTLTTYLGLLESNGFTRYADNTIDNNRYFTYTDKDNVVTLMYPPADQRMRVSVEPLKKTALPAKEDANTYTKGVCSTTVSQVGLWYTQDPETDENINGLCHVIRLEDGSFIIIDGGHETDVVTDQLIKVLEKQAPDRNQIVIAAWIFTHAHRDHVGAFIRIGKNMPKNWKVERFIYSFPNAVDADGAASAQNSVDNLVNNSYPDAERIVAHPGQVFWIRNAKIQMLFTLDLLYPTKPEFYNNASLVFTIDLEGQKLMYQGDMGPEADTIIRKLYSAALKSDILQVAHHGFKGASVQMHEAVRPTYVLVPSGWWEKTKNLYGNPYFESSMKSDDPDKVKEIWVAFKGVQILTLKSGQDVTAQTWETVPEYLAS